MAKWICGQVVRLPLTIATPTPAPDHPNLFYSNSAGLGSHTKEKLSLASALHGPRPWGLGRFLWNQGAILTFTFQRYAGETIGCEGTHFHESSKRKMPIFHYRKRIVQCSTPFTMSPRVQYSLFPIGFQSRICDIEAECTSMETSQGKPHRCPDYWWLP